MDLALNNLQRLICHKTQPTNQSNNSKYEEIKKVRTFIQNNGHNHLMILYISKNIFFKAIQNNQKILVSFFLNMDNFYFVFLSLFR